MLDQDDDLDRDDDLEAKNKLNRKKMLIIILPVLIVIGLSVGFYYVFNRDYHSGESAYSVVKKPASAEGEESITIFYDLPDVSATLKTGKENKQRLRLRLNLELSNIEDIKTIEILTPKINDAVLTHIIELTPEEAEGSTGLYWLKEELLYRVNLITAPIKINNLNFKSFEVQKEETK